VAEAQKWLGTPYSFGAGDAKGPTVGKTGKGFDCSGFIKYLYAKDYGIDLPHLASAQASMGVPVKQEDLQPGDVVFFGQKGKEHHEGLYLGNGQFIHAPHTGDVVKISSLSDSYYQKNFAGGRRYAPAA
jgi:cell wall-associated NlpC family hydrolase